jgi:arylsulfatase A
MKRRELLGMAGAAGALTAGRTAAAATPTGRRSNFIVILCDDLGFGDIEPGGGRLIKTPHLARMAREGVQLTDYYAPHNLCTPSRAAMLTGRYAVRCGLGRQVIMQTDPRALPLSEITLAEALAPDYATAMIGKWHLGHLGPTWSPTNHGFDLFFGIPYSHDMAPLKLVEAQGTGEPASLEFQLPQLQQRFCARAEQFIETNRAKPFYLQLALSAPHLPSHPTPPFEGHSQAGAYGDVVQEIDDIVGRLLAKLRALNLDQDTLVIFTSDNGPWFEGSAGTMRGRKGGAGYDGGFRVPFIARQPGAIRGGRKSDAIAMGIDVLPTLLKMAGRPLPAAVLDGKDISGVLLRGEASPHDELVLFDNEDAVAIRTQRWKYVSVDYYRTVTLPMAERGYPLLYDLKLDPTENYSVAARHPDVLRDMQARLARAQAAFSRFKTPVPAASG